MARDRDLEEIVRQRLSGLPRLEEKPMFGGLAFMMNGNLLCCTGTEGLLVRLGKGNDGWALTLPGVEPLYSGVRPMVGWVRANASVHPDPDMREKLIAAAIHFVEGLPAK